MPSVAFERERSGRGGWQILQQEGEGSPSARLFHSASSTTCEMKFHHSFTQSWRANCHYFPGFDFYFPEPWGANHSGFVVKLIPFVWCIIVVSAKQITTVHEYIHPRVSTMKAISIFYPFFLLFFSLTPFLHGCVKWVRLTVSLKSFCFGKFSWRTFFERLGFHLLHFKY